MIVTRRKFRARWLACTLATAAVLAPVGCASDPGPSPQAQQTASAGQSAGPTAGPTEASPTASPEVSFTVTITGDTVSPEPQRVNVQRGQVVRLEVRSDHENSIHIHGYGLERPVKPDQPAVFVFTADQTGLFEVEAHHPSLQLLQLLVR